MLPQIAGAIRNVEALFRDEWTTSAAVYLPVPTPRTLHRNPQLAATYRRILDESHGDLDAAYECWYRGFVADAMLAFQQRQWMDSSGDRHAGLLADADLRDWRPTHQAPLPVSPIQPTASRLHPASAIRPAGTPCTWTLSTGGATWSPRRRAVAGFGAHLSFPSSASALAHARRPFGLRRNCRTRSSRASDR